MQTIILNTETVADYRHFASPLHQKHLLPRVGSADFVAGGLAIDGRPVGLIYAEAKRYTKIGLVYAVELDSIYNSTAATEALLRFTETELASRGSRTLSLPLLPNGPASLLIALQSLDWPAPMVRTVHYKLNCDMAMQLGRWLRNGASIRSYEIIPWDSASVQEVDSLRRADWYPYVFSPFEDFSIGDIYRPVSLWVRCEGELVGWLIARQVEDHALHYGPLYIRENARGMMLSPHLFYEAGRLQLQHGVIYASFDVQTEQTDMLRFMDKWPRPATYYRQEIRTAIKQI